jgi:hypothetical protein
MKIHLGYILVDVNTPAVLSSITKVMAMRPVPPDQVRSRRPQPKWCSLQNKSKTVSGRVGRRRSKDVPSIEMGFFRVAIVLIVTMAHGFCAHGFFAVCAEVIDAILDCRVLS